VSFDLQFVESIVFVGLLKISASSLLILTMPIICEGRPDGPCPDRRLDNTVRGSQGDLMLCRNCELYRFPYLAKPATNYGAAESDSSGHAAASSKVSLSAATAGSSEKISAESAKPHQNLVLCDVLCFVSSKYDSFPRSVIKDTLIGFYGEEELLLAKQCLINAASDKSVIIQQYSRRRIGENKLKSTVDDIMQIWSAVDEHGKLDTLPTFCSANITRIPVIPDEMSDLAYLRKTVAELKMQVDELTAMVTTLISGVIHAPAVPQAKTIARDIITGDIHDNQVTEVTAGVSVQSPVSNYSAAVKVLPPSARDGDRPSARPSTDAGFTTVVNKKKVKKRPLNLTGNNQESTQLQGVEKKLVFCVGRLKPDTTVGLVTDFLGCNGVTVHFCYVAVKSATNNSDQNIEIEQNSDENSDPDTVNDAKPQRKHISMRVCVSQSDKSTVFNPDLWPVGVTVRPWIFKQGNRKPRSVT